MYSSIIVQVIHNTIYAIIGLIFVITYNYIPSSDILFPSGTRIVLFASRTVFVLLTVSIFMAGIGNLLKYIIREGASGPGDFIEGIRLNFSRVLKFNILIFIVSLFLVPAALIFKPSMMMGLFLTEVLFNYINFAIIVLISPFFVLWYPAMVMDNLGIIDSIKTALMTGKKLYYKLLPPVFVPLVPSLLYQGYISLIDRAYGINIFSYSYYILFGTTFVLSLFAMLYIFKIYDDVEQGIAVKSI